MKIYLIWDAQGEISLENDVGESLNISVEQILYSVRQKLEGTCSGCDLSFEGVVNKLIVEATNPKMLCSMFHGWTAWL